MKTIFACIIASYSILVAAESVIIGSYVNDKDEVVQLTAEVMVVQGDEKFLMPRGNNFVKNAMVSLDPERRSILELIGKSETGLGGLLQPNPDAIDLGEGYKLKWFVDETYKVKGYGFLLGSGEVIPGTNMPLLDSEAKADARITSLKNK